MHLPFLAAASVPTSLRFLAESDGVPQPLRLTAAATPGSPRRFEMVAYTGGKLLLKNYPHPVVIDLAGLRGHDSPRPVIRDHQMGRELGHADRLVNDGRRLAASGIISHQNQDVTETLAAHDNGFPWKISVGCNVLKAELLAAGQTKQVNGQTITGPAIIALQAELRELSVLSIAADDSTSFSMAATAGDQTITLEADTMNFAEWLVAQGFDPNTISDTQRASLQAMYDREQGTAAPAASTPAAAAAAAPLAVAASSHGRPAVAVTGTHAGTLATPATDAQAGVLAYRQQLAAEDDRINRIRTVCAGAHLDIQAQAIRDGWDPIRAELAVLRASRATGPAIHSGGDGASSFDGTVIEAAMCLHAGLRPARVGEWYNQQTMNRALERPMRGFGIHALMHQVIHAAGLHAQAGVYDNDFIRTALRAGQKLEAAGFSTLSLPGVLANTANKVLLDAYTAVEVVWPQLAAIGSNNDFKIHTRYRLDSKGSFKKVGPDGELKHGSLSEAGYTTQLDTFGLILALNRQMIINDDLYAFLDLPKLMGRLAALRIEEAFFVLLLSNPSSFFGSGNRNYASGGGTALSLSSLTTAEQKFRDMVDSNGKPVLVSPKTLLVPTTLGPTANNIYTAQFVNETTTADTPKANANPHVGKWQPVISPYLSNTNITDQDGAAISGQSSTGWYLLADAMIRAAIRIAFLNGQQTPTLESAETDFSTLGMQWRMFHDFGLGMEDPNAAVNMAGA